MERFTKAQLMELDKVIANFAKKYNFGPMTMTQMIGIIYQAHHEALSKVLIDILRDQSKDN